MDQLSEELQARFAAQGLQVWLTPVGAYRAALDNEVIVRGDVQKAIFFSTLGIALLLLLAFPRPLIGLLSLLPAVVGTVAAFFVFALLRPSISVMVSGLWRRHHLHYRGSRHRLSAFPGSPHGIVRQGGRPTKFGPWGCWPS